MLEYHADTKCSCVARVWYLHRFATPAYLAAVRSQHTVDDFDQRALAGTVLAEQGVNLTRGNLEIDLVVGKAARKLLADTRQRQ